MSDDIKKYVGIFKKLVNGMMAKNIAWTVMVELQIFGWCASWFTEIIPFLGLILGAAVQIIGYIVGFIGLIMLLSPIILILWPPTYRDANWLKECCHPVFATHFWGLFGMLWALTIALTWGLIFWAVYFFSIMFLFSWIPGTLMICALPLFPALAGVTVALTGWEFDNSDKKVVPISSGK